MQHSSRLIALAAVLATPLGACATVINGSDQPLGVVTTPPGATCTLSRDGKVIAQVSPTPGQVQVEKSKHDIIIACEMAGYQKTEVIAQSTFNGATFGNLIVGGIVGVAVDAASGANNEYPESLTITLTPIQVAPAATPAAPVAALETPTS